MTNRGLAFVLLVTMGYVAGALYAIHATMRSTHGVPGTDRAYPGFVFVWDWWRRSSPADVYDDADVIAYVSSMIGYGLYPHEVQERGKWLVHPDHLAGHDMAFIGRYDQPNIHHYAPFFADHRERARTIIVLENALLGNWDAEPTPKETILAAMFLVRHRLEQGLPEHLRYDPLGEVREANRSLVAQSLERPYFRELTQVDDQTIDEVLKMRLILDGLAGVRFTGLPTDTRQTLEQFVRDGNEVWILSMARSEVVEPVYGKRMVPVREAIADFAAEHPGIEHLYFPPMQTRFYRDHGHVNPAGSEVFRSWLAAQLHAHDAGQPLPGAAPAQWSTP